MKELQIFGNNIGEYLMTLPHKIDKFSYIKGKTYHLIKRHLGKRQVAEWEKIFCNRQKIYIQNIYKLQIMRER